VKQKRPIYGRNVKSDYGLLGGIGEGLKAGLQGYMTVRDAADRRQQAALEAAMRQKQIEMMKQHYDDQLIMAGFNGAAISLAEIVASAFTTMYDSAVSNVNFIIQKILKKSANDSGECCC
jgi:hypothetical protein